MTTQHTPVPWTIEASESPLDFQMEFWIQANNNYLCSVNNKNDASLIAAAPDLLEALKKSREGIESMTAWEHEDDPVKPFSDCLKLIDAAIAKATGVLK
jgi:hypothetical protein